MLEIPLRKHGGEWSGRLALADNESVDDIIGRRWFAVDQGHNVYAATYIDGKLHYMHTVCIRPDDGLVVDHLNHDGLDNRLSNLRMCTKSEDNRNRRRWVHATDV